MLSFVLVLLYSSGLWLLRQILVPWVGGFADLIIVVLPLWWWWNGQRLAAVASLLVASLLVDIVASPVLPLFFLTSLLAGWCYVEFLEPHLISGTSLGQLLALGAWLLLWRLWRIILIAQAWFGGGDLAAPTNFSVLEPLGWLGFGLVVWWSIQSWRRLLWYLQKRTL